MPLQVAGFGARLCFPDLRQLHAKIENRGRYEVEAHRFLIEAKCLSRLVLAHHSFVIFKELKVMINGGSASIVGGNGHMRRTKVMPLVVVATPSFWCAATGLSLCLYAEPFP